MNRLPLATRAQIIHLLVEGMGIRAAARVADVSTTTVLKLLGDVGEACARYHNSNVRNLTSKRLELDEIWGFVFAKQAHVTKAMIREHGMVGDVWTWVAIDPETKLVASWLVGRRTAVNAHAFVADLAGRLKRRVQLTTDGLKLYVEAVDQAFGAAVDYAQLVKMYGEECDIEHRYSPSEYVGSRVEIIRGRPNPKNISTSIVERNNLSIRMSTRRLTRLTNAYSKNAHNHVHALSLDFFTYNFVKIHSSIRVSPAMEAGVTNRLWSYEDVARL